MTYRSLKWLTIFLPPLVIGGFEFVRHDFLLAYMTMETGNYLITLLTLLLSYVFATWMFRTIEQMSARIAEEQARRAVYEERERLARELHDNLAQTLFLLNVKLRQRQLDEAKSAVAQIDQTLRQAIFNLRSTLEESSSLAARIGKWLSEWSTLTGIDVQQEVALPEGYFSPGDEIHLFGVIQEAFTNIRKHAGATSARLHLFTDRSGWRLMIWDNGRGITQTAVSERHYGLSMMKERADKLGASFAIGRDEAGGSVLTLCGRRR
ncbi:histidine kinase [Brevibacillus humidisoli]|uniref:sensor histidine kinase n=1 Tax=Brevibacillus humidisoli TaxID=2895522 RepID=UPI001E35C838|nr:histidine kinase [Brevibacillus humidisoli]UFJ38938.1 histidine kinase [Brevibacillus humidisoli]